MQKTGPYIALFGGLVLAFTIGTMSKFNTDSSVPANLADSVLTESDSDTRPILTVSIPITDASGVQSAVDAAIQSERAIVFVYVNWALMKRQSDQFDEFANEWHQRHRDAPVKFHRIDFTPMCQDYAAITSLQGYDEWEKDAGRHPFGGNGEWAWISKGKLVDIGCVIGCSNAEILARSEAAFAPTEDLQ